MENYELNIISPPKRQHNYFPKGHIPFNKNIPMKEWMDGRKIKRVLKCLEIGRKLGNKNLPAWNSKEVVGIKDGKLIAFNNAANAARILKARGIKISQRNINKVCHGKPELIQEKYIYIRLHAGGFRWFFANDIDKYKDLIK